MSMKKLVKKFGAFLLMVMVLGAMTACGSASKESTDNSGTSATDNTETTASAGTEEVSDTLKALREKGTLVVGSSGDAPFAYIDQATGEFKGVDAEIIKEAAKRLGIEKVEMQLIPFSELILNLNSNNIDIIADCMYIRADRAKQVCFGEVWYTQGGGLIVPEDSSIKGQEDFDPASTIVGYTTGTIWQTVVEKWKSDGLIKDAVATGDQTESIVALQYGKIDAFLTDSTVLENLFANSPDTVKGLKLCENYTDSDDTVGHIAPSVKKSDEAFMKELNAVIVQLRDEGFIEKVFKDYGLDPKLHMITNDERVYEPAE